LLKDKAQQRDLLKVEPEVEKLWVLSNETTDFVRIHNSDIETRKELFVSNRKLLGQIENKGTSAESKVFHEKIINDQELEIAFIDEE